MSKQNEELMVELKSPFKIAKGDDEEEVDFISMSPPTGKISHICASLKSAFFTAVSKLTADTEEKADEEDIKGSDIVNMLYMSGINMEKVIITAHSLIKAVGSAGGEKDMTQPMIDRMNPDDIEKCLGEYLANFIRKSALQEMKAG